MSLSTQGNEEKAGYLLEIIEPAARLRIAQKRGSRAAIADWKRRCVGDDDRARSPHPAPSNPGRWCSGKISRKKACDSVVRCSARSDIASEIHAPVYLCVVHSGSRCEPKMMFVNVSRSAVRVNAGRLNQAGGSNQNSLNPAQTVPPRSIMGHQLTAIC